MREWICEEHAKDFHVQGTSAGWFHGYDGGVIHNG